jgi:hypothetical protein
VRRLRWLEKHGVWKATYEGATVALVNDRVHLGSGPDAFQNVLAPMDQRNINNWIDKPAFALAPNDRFGDAGPGQVLGPGLQSYDISVAKNFRVRERYNLKFQTDFFNAFNVANFNSLDTNVSDQAFGTLSAAYPPRNLQMQLKLTF